MARQRQSPIRRCQSELIAARMRWLDAEIARKTTTSHIMHTGEGLTLTVCKCGRCILCRKEG